MPMFTKEEYKEIEESRARLQAYKDKIQPYPSYPIQPQEPIREEPTEVIVKKMFIYVGVDKKALELQKRLVSLEETLKEHPDKKKKGRYTKYVVD